jgi:hypothetical protein
MPWKYEGNDAGIPVGLHEDGEHHITEGGGGSTYLKRPREDCG